MATPRKPNRMTRLNYLKRELAETHKDIEHAREGNSWVAVATLRRQALALRTEVDGLQDADRAAKIAEHKLTDDQIVEEVAAAIAVLPVSVVEEIMEACEHRVGAARLSLVK